MAYSWPQTAVSLLCPSLQATLAPWLMPFTRSPSELQQDHTDRPIINIISTAYLYILILCTAWIAILHNVYSLITSLSCWEVLRVQRAYIARSSCMHQCAWGGRTCMGPRLYTRYMCIYRFCGFYNVAHYKWIIHSHVALYTQGIYIICPYIKAM